MTEIHTDLATASTLPDETVDAAATAMRRAGARLRAPQADVDAVLTALFSTVITGTTAPKPPKVTTAPAAGARRANLTEEEKQEIRVQLAEGRTQQEIADDFRISRSTIANVKTGSRR